MARWTSAARLFVVGHVAVVGHRHPAAVRDELHGQVRVAAAAFTMNGGTEVVHHDPRPMFGQFECMGPAYPVSGSRHDGHLFIQQPHAILLQANSETSTG